MEVLLYNHGGAKRCQDPGGRELGPFKSNLKDGKVSSTKLSKGVTYGQEMTQVPVYMEKEVRMGKRNAAI